MVRKVQLYYVVDVEGKKISEYMTKELAENSAGKSIFKSGALKGKRKRRVRKGRVVTFLN